MNPLLEPACHPDWDDWQWQLAHAVRTPEAIRDALALDDDRTHAEVCAVHTRYPLLATPYYLSLAQRGRSDDPIVRQCLPDRRELDPHDGAPDPLAEERDSPVPGLVHRYRDRVLVVTTNICAVHCRHCMRKRAWGTPEHLTAETLRAMVDYVAAETAIREVILSGGDPLLLPDARIAELLDSFLAVPHVDIVRIGSRVPVVLPQRITPALCALLSDRAPLWLATHFNHPGELTDRTARAARDLIRAGVSLVNQTVLLRGVNDSAACLRKLFTGLLRLGIKPYYLFHGDPVQGTMHFRTGVRKGLSLMAALRREISGLAMPAYALDLPDGQGKVRLEPECEAGLDPQGIPRYRDADGRPAAYPDA